MMIDASKQTVPNYDMIGGNGNAYGPVSADQIRRWVSEKRANAGTHIRLSGLVEWGPISSFSEFNSSFPELHPTQESELTEDVEAEIPPPATPASLPFTVGGCLGGGRDLLNRNFMPIAGGCLAVWMVNMALNFIPLVGVIAVLFLIGPLYGALFRMVLDRKRGLETTFFQAWSGLQAQVPTLIVAGALGAILTALGYLLLVPGLYLTIAWSFGFLFIIDQKTDAWTGLENSRRTITASFQGVALLLIICFMPLLIVSLYGGIQLAGELMKIINTGPITSETLKLLANKIGPMALIIEVVRLLVMPLATCVIVEAYERLIGSPSRTIE
ncbi:MAG: GYF domain-containing protein [Verrucomicrobia bacterium]|nr:GYF domain-containing protein [Verrucomicrobiota bacterium]